MKGKIAVWAIAAALLVSTAAIARAQDSTTTQQTTTTTTTTNDANTEAQDNSMTNSHSDVRSVTGCLQKGDSANEYELTSRDGSTWELRSDAVDLASHVGQTVTITGAVRNSDMHNMKEDAKKEAQEHGMDKSATEHGHMTVTDVSMVRRSCS